MSGEPGNHLSIPSEWIPLENRFYRCFEQYSQLQWSLSAKDLSNAIIAIAPCAGPIALVPEAGWGLSYALAVYSLSGHLVHRFERIRDRTVPPFRVIALGWSTADLLTVVYNDGLVLRIPSGLHLAESRTINVEPSSKQNIHDAAVCNTSDVVLRASSGAIYIINAADKVMRDKNAIPPPEAVSREVPNCGIAVIAPDISSQSTPETLLLTNDAGLALVNSYGASYMRGSMNAVCIAVSQNNQYVAAMDTESGTLLVSTVDLRTEVARVNLVVELSVLGVENMLSEHIFDAKTPESVAWVGSDAIAVLYKEKLVLVGPRGAVAVLPLDSRFEVGGVVVESEVDGLRLLSASCVHFVQMVPEPVNSVLYDKQTSGHKLLRSSGGFATSAESSEADALTRYRLLRELRESGSLLEGSRCCVAAAYLETHAITQKRLLEAAAYGQRYASVFGGATIDEVHSRKEGSGRPAMLKRREERSRRDTNMVPTAIAILRVLNASSAASAGIPLTKPQFDILGLPELVARLSRYGQHTLSIRLAAFGGISPSDVLSEWAKTVIRTNPNESDEAIMGFIAERFESISRSYTAVGVHGSMHNKALPYVRAAESAYAAGRPRCAELLLRKESRPARKVSMFLKMGREGPAIIAAVASGDPELVLDALGTILETKKVRETARLLRSLPPALGNRAADLFATHLKQIGDLNALKLLYTEIGRRREAALVDIHRAYHAEDPKEHLEELKKAVVTVGKGYSRRTCHFEVQALQHAAAVAAAALEVEKRGKLEAETLRYANDGDLLARAVLDISDAGRRRETLSKLRRELRVPDRRFFWVCLHSMAEAGDFQSIEDLSHSAGYGRAPPIGLPAFVDTCIKYHMDDEAVKYAMRIADLRERARALARCGRGREAAEIASRLRNQQLLEEVQDLAARHVAHITIPLS